MCLVHLCGAENSFDAYYPSGYLFCPKVLFCAPVTLKGGPMSTLVKSAVLSLSLLAGATVSAYAQSDNIAALPPNAAATPAPQGAVVAPSPAYVGPAPGITWSAQEKQTQPVQPSPAYVGPAPGVTWSAQESQTQPVQPSPEYVGPKLN
jgi:hypothetical protein